jgi:tyrosyl-tRNA synthetase
MPEATLSGGDGGLPIANVLRDAGLTSSTSEALRMIRQGAVRIDGVRIEDERLVVQAGSAHVFQVGKRRFAKVHLG